MAGDANTVVTRIRAAILDLLSVVASPDRPLVMVLDDLQWAGPAAVGFIDAVLTDERLAGVLVVGAYRSDEVGTIHPLATAITRWERPTLVGAAPAQLRLVNLAPADLGEMLAEMLRLPAHEAADLADAVGVRLGGNPFDTVELVNSLRRDGALMPGEVGWTWDAATIRRFVGRGDVLDLLSARIGALPPASQQIMEIMAGLGLPLRRAHGPTARDDPDVVCRYGGEEFAAILPGADEATTLAVAERIRATVATVGAPHSATDTGVVTVSIGVAAYTPGTSIKAEELIAIADLGLYDAKQNGRNQVRSVQRRPPDQGGGRPPGEPG